MKKVIKIIIISIFVLSAVVLGLKLIFQPVGEEPAPTPTSTPTPVATSTPTPVVAPTQTPAQPILPTSPFAGLSSQPKTAQTPPACCNHPYWHSVWRATSSDGKTWSAENRLLIDHASVPHPVQLTDGRIVVYYVNGSVDTFDCSVSDDGINFRHGDCKLYNYTTQKAWDPYVIRLENGKYRLFFFGPEHPQDPGGLPSEASNKIYSALSDDGLNFIQEPGIRFQEPQITDPAVIFFNGTWRMYTAKGQKTVVATSMDGNTFAKIGEYDTGGSVPDILNVGDSLFLFVCSQGISYMTPPEMGGTAKTVAIAPEPGKIICDPGIVRLASGEYIMYYKKQALTGPK